MVRCNKVLEVLTVEKVVQRELHRREIHCFGEFNGSVLGPVRNDKA